MSEERKILVAEDERILRTLLDTTLTQNGYGVFLAEDGIEAVNIFKEYKDEIDLLLLDVMMPNLNGWDTYNKILEIDSSIKVIFSSGFSDDVLVKESIINNDDIEIVQKPYRIGALLDIIKDKLED